MNGAVRTARADAPATPERTPHIAALGCAGGDVLPHTSRTAASLADPSGDHNHGPSVILADGPDSPACRADGAPAVGGADVHLRDGSGRGQVGAPDAENNVPHSEGADGGGRCGHDLIQPQTPHTVNHKLAVVLFEGAGGSTAGLHAAGYTTVGFEYWQPAVTCAQANGFDSRLHDLSDPTLDHLVPYAPLWWASPPCQPFSAAGQGEGEFDGRDGFPWLLRLVALRLPEVLIVENVKGLTFAKHSGYFCNVLEGLRALGYEADWRVLMAADYGVPQTRERCIIVCRRDGGPITWPMPTHCETGGMFTAPWVTMADALGWGGDEPYPTITVGHSDALGLGGSASRAKINGWIAANPRRTTLHYRQTNAAGELITCDVTDRPAPTIGTSSQSQWLLQWGSPTSMNKDLRRPPTQPAPTATGTDAGHFRWVADDSEPIRLTIPELAALQGFPADWTWTGTKTQQARMVGNAVPPALAAAVANVNRPATLERAA